MEATVEPLENNRVKLHVAVPAAEFEKAIDAAFRKLAHEVKVPGLPPRQGARAVCSRPGSAPRPRRKQALRDSLPGLLRRGGRGRGHRRRSPRPRSTITAGEEEGDVEFDAVVEVRPVVELVGYDALPVEFPSPAGRRRGRRRRRSTRCASASPTSRTSQRAAHRRRLRRDRHQGLRRRRGRSTRSRATDFLYEVGSGMRRPRARRRAARQAARRHPQVRRRLDDRFGERPARRSRSRSS